MDVAGKVVVMLRRTPRHGETGDKRFDTHRCRRDEDSTHAAFVTKIENAVAHKAAGVIIVNDSATAGTRDSIPQLRQARHRHNARHDPGPVLQARGARLD